MFLNKKKKIVIFAIFIVAFFLVGIKLYFNFNPIQKEVTEEPIPIQKEVTEEPIPIQKEVTEEPIPIQKEVTEEPIPIVFNWLSYNEALLKAEKESKSILVFFYSDGCSWCDKMEREVYANNEVKKILADKFVSVKINASSNNKVEVNGEEITEKAFSLSYQVTGYPTTWFLEDKDKGIAPLPGYIPAEQFVTVLKYIGEEWYKKITFQEYVENKEG